MLKNEAQTLRKTLWQTHEMYMAASDEFETCSTLIATTATVTATKIHI